MAIHNFELRSQIVYLFSTVLPAELEVHTCYLIICEVPDSSLQMHQQLIWVSRKRCKIIRRLRYSDLQ